MVKRYRHFRMEVFRMCLYMSFPIFIWWTANQDFFYEKYIRPHIEKQRPEPPEIWETMYRARLAETEAKEQVKST